MDQHRRGFLQDSARVGAFALTSAALWRICRYSRGIPRLINAVCDKCCLAGFVQQRDQIDYRMVGLAVRELEGHIAV